jgi:prepilin peptidase CpaA
MGIHSVAWWPTFAVLAVATFTDLRSRRIPNWLVLPFMAAGVMLATVLHGWRGLGGSMEGLALGALIFGILCAMGGMGMGDVKLFAAIGAWVGPGGVMAICWALMSGFLPELLKGSGDLMFGWKARGLKPPADLRLSNPMARKMPYAPAIAIGTLLSFFAH